jgi:predicted PolB exonuclease-like 3'-5' exonuclease
MRFSVIAVSTVPDADTTRRLFDLQDLDNKAVSKVLFNRRRQQTGTSEVLRWDQRAIASISLVRHTSDQVRIDGLNLDSHRERDMLDAFYEAALRDGLVVFWNDADSIMPLIRFRSLKYGVSHPAYWQLLRQREALHMDILSWISAASEDRPGLDETARRLGLPGMLNRTEDDVFNAWLQERHDDVQAYSDLVAVNTYLLALQLFGVTGQMTGRANERMRERLREVLIDCDAGHFTAFVDAWSET